VNSQIRARDIKYGLKSTEFLLSFPKGEMKIKTHLIGRHNLYNILAAFSWGYQEGISCKDIKAAIENFSFVPGRLEKIENKKRFYVFVDYAHSEDSLKNILLSLRGLSPKRLITLFGCGGERDKLKRPKMGRVATELSDFVVITNDNPRSERPQDIIKEIKKGIKRANFLVVLDRREAIRMAISMAKEGDIVVVAGKGHENYQVLKDRVVHFDDREEVRLCLPR
jgi:UDP-N-acetylmuramoyl-L-alanyl-D-glutamate--2,6-diaminopimelate ligase